MGEQIAIALLGVTAIFLSQDHRQEYRRWACILGLLGQPFWFYATWKAGQWGIFALCFLYTLSWARGVYTNWILPLRLSSAERGEPNALNSPARSRATDDDA